MNRTLLMRMPSRTQCVLAVATLTAAGAVPTLACDEKAKKVVVSKDAPTAVVTLAGAPGDGCCRDAVSDQAGEEEAITYLQAVGAVADASAVRSSASPEYSGTWVSAAPKSSGLWVAGAPKVSGAWVTAAHDHDHDHDHAHGDHEHGHAVAVVVDGDKVIVHHNGKKVPDHRIKHDGKRIIILDESGEEISGLSIDLDLEGPSAHLFSSGDFKGALAFPGDNVQGNVFFSPPAETPPVMLGILMEKPGPALAAHLGFEPEKASLITALYEGLPASEAGVRQYDVIVGVEDASSAAPDALRATLKKKKPGNMLRLKVIQKGQPKLLEVKLRAYDASKMQDAAVIGRVDAPFGVGGMSPMPDDLRGYIRTHTPREWRDRLLVTPEHEIFEWVPDLQKHLRDHDFLRRQDKDGAEAGTRLEELEKRLKDLNRLLEKAESQRRDQVDPSSALDRLEERLKKLEQRLDKLLERSEGSR